jgi:hypothetical protein
MNDAFRSGRPAAAEATRLIHSHLHQAATILATAPRGATLHQSRSHMKRARAVLRLLRDQPGALKLEKRIRQAAHLVAPAREADALIEVWDEFRARAGAPDPALEGVAAALLERRAQIEPIDYAAAADKLACLADRASALELNRRGFALLRRGLRHEYRAARRRLARAAHGDDAQVHAWRTSLKAHMLHCEALHRADPRSLPQRAQRLHQISRALGEHHDLLALEALIAAEPHRFGNDQDLAKVRALITARKADLLSAAVRDAKPLFSDTSCDFTRKLRHAWRTWRTESKPADADEPAPTQRQRPRTDSRPQSRSKPRSRSRPGPAAVEVHIRDRQHA